MIFPLFVYILRAAVRDRLLWSVAGVVAVVIALSVFFGASSVTEQNQFALAFSAYGFRLFGVVALCLFVVSFIRRSFEARDIEFLLSRPVGRIAFVTTHAIAFSSLAAFVAFVLGGTTAVIMGGHVYESFFVWWLSLAVEFIIMANVAMFFSFVMTSPTACTMIVFAFYLLARLMGEILGILTKGASTGIMTLLSRAMEVISMLIPRLDMMGQAKWVVYNATAEVSFGFIVLQGLVFVALTVAATCIDLKRRQF